MSFGGKSQPAQTVPMAPPAPANPPMYGENMRKGKPQQTPSMQFSASVLGSLPQQVMQRSLLGGGGSFRGG